MECNMESTMERGIVHFIDCKFIIGVVGPLRNHPHYFGSNESETLNFHLRINGKWVYGFVFLTSS